MPKERQIRMHRQRGYNEVELANREWEREEKKQTKRDTNVVREREIMQEGQTEKDLELENRHKQTEE